MGILHFSHVREHHRRRRFVDKLRRRGVERDAHLPVDGSYLECSLRVGDR